MMDTLVKEVPESIKLHGVENYVLWSYKVKMLNLYLTNYGQKKV
jgi:hypothetical protein